MRLFLIPTLLLGGFSLATSVEASSGNPLATPSRMRIEYDVSQKPTRTTPQADVLIVIDDSGSMQAHHTKFASALDSLISAATASGADLNFGVITTSNESYVPGGQGRLSRAPGVLSGTVNSRSSDFLSVLQKNLGQALTTQGSATEVAFTTMMNALSSPLRETGNKDFRREITPLSIILLSDADDQSNFPVETFTDFVKADSPAGIAPSLNLIMVETPSQSCQTDGGAPPIRTKQAQQILGSGEIVDICEADLTIGMDRIGKAVARLADQAIGMPGSQPDPIAITLPVTPDYTSLVVSYGSRVLRPGNLAAGYTYDSATRTVYIRRAALTPTQPAQVPLVIEFSVSP